MDDVELLSSFVVPCRYDHAGEGQFRDIQDRRIRAQLEKAYENVPYWHDLMDDARIRPGEIRTAGDLSRLPLSTKNQIVSRPTRDRLGSDPSKLIQRFTSGTTGPPMEVYYSISFILSTLIYLYGHFRRWYGLGRMFKVLQISSVSPVAPSLVPKPGEAARSPAWQRRARGEATRPGAAIFWPAIDRFVRSAHFEKRIETVLPVIKTFAPDVIMINVSYLRMLAERAGETVAEIRPKVLIATGEPLDEPTRSYVERRLGSPVCQMYGSNETGSLALDCLEGRNLHIFSDRAIVEVLSKDGKPVRPGEIGEIVVSELLNQGMPLLRYKMRDLGYSSSEMCPCGRSLPILKSVEGRQIDCITTRDGRLVTPKRILALMHSAEGLPRCQLVQRSQDSFTLRVFPGSGASDPNPDGLISELVAALRSELGSQVDISVSIVQVDEPQKRKMRPVIVQISSRPEQHPIS
jgi:phenylacetate-CoA ligase